MKAVEETVKKGFNDFMEKSLAPAMEEISLKNARKVVEMALIERSVKGRDITGLDTEQKIAFAKQVQSVFRGNRDGALRVKANEALIEEQDNRGGYLVEPEVAAAILRIAASVGTIMKQCQQWPMKTDELGIPNYTGSFLTGSYVGVDLPGTVTGLTFGQAVLIARKWQLAFTVGNDLLADASVQLADWLMAMAGEALANMVDQQGFVGGTVGTAPGPFVGILNTANVNTYTLAAAKHDVREVQSDHGRWKRHRHFGGIDLGWRRMVHAPHRLGCDPHRIGFDFRLALFVPSAASWASDELAHDADWRPDQAGRRHGRIPGLHEPLAPRNHRWLAGEHCFHHLRKHEGVRVRRQGRLCAWPSSNRARSAAKR